MCKTYDAIFELAKHVESNILICFLNHLRIEGIIHDCSNKEQGKCYDEIVTLEDVKVICPKTGYQQQFAWLNVPSRHIQSFAFKCCERGSEKEMM